MIVDDNWGDLVIIELETGIGKERWVSEPYAHAPRCRSYALDGVDWHEAPIPRRRHRCTPQTFGWLDFVKVKRCACGAISYNGGRWNDRNARLKKK